MIQCTGPFESGDALRNMLHEWKLPIYSMIGYRSYLNQDTLLGDTTLVFTEPIHVRSDVYGSCDVAGLSPRARATETSAGVHAGA